MDGIFLFGTFTCIPYFLHRYSFSIFSEKQMAIVDNIRELKKMITGIGQEGGESSGGLECFSVEQAKPVTDYVQKK